MKLIGKEWGNKYLHLYSVNGGHYELDRGFQPRYVPRDQIEQISHTLEEHAFGGKKCLVHI